MNVNQINTLVLAYIGDSVYELNVRDYLVKKGINKVNDLQTASKNYVSAKNQALYLSKLLENNILEQDEIDVVKRARNTKVNSKPKNTDIITYKHATALEALIGYLYLDNKKQRMVILIDYILEACQ